MRMKPIGTFALGVALSLAAPAALADDKAMAAPKPPEELSQLAYFTGSWTCSGKTFANPMGPEHATQGNVKVSSVLGGYWYMFHYDEMKTAANSMPYHAAGFWGYDSGAKAFVGSCHDSFGGSCQQTSKGWTGDTLVWEGPGSMGGQKTVFRDTFTKKGAEQTHMGEMQGPDGKWMKMDEETCKKAAKK